MAYRARLTDYFCQHDRGWVLSLFALVCAIYLPFLGNQFFFDDRSFFLTGAAEASMNTWLDLRLRWLPYASFGSLYSVFSAELPHVYRLADMLLHGINTVLLFYFLRHLIGAVQGQGNETAVTVRGAWFGALVFALHPVAAFAAGYMIQISILMATTFALLMLLAYLRGLLSGERRWFAFAVLAYFLACFSKEHSVLMPAVLAAMGLLVRTEKRVSWHVVGLTWAAFIAIALLVTLRARGVLGSPYEPLAAQLFAQQGIDDSTPILHLLSALTQAGLFFKYLLLWILPDPMQMSIDMRESFIDSVSSWRGWLGGAAFVLYGALGISLLLRGGKRGLAGFAMLYPWLLFWVEMVGIRMQEPFVLYRSYLWMPGTMVLIPLALEKLSKRKAMLAMAGLAILLAALSWGRLRIFSDNYRLWNEAATLLKSEQAIGADRIYFNRGQAEMDAKNWEDAIADFRRAAAISPQVGPTHYLLGLALLNSGHPEEALAQFDIAIALNPEDGRVYYSKGFLLKVLHRDKEAMQQMEQGCKLGNKMACVIVSMSGRQ